MLIENYFADFPRFFSKMRQIAFLLAIVVCTCLAIRPQAVGVTGRLMCGDKPAAGVKVKLWDEDDGKTVRLICTAFVDNQLQFRTRS
ncbi:hypothetical protein Y032_0581g275 [Ancylostoma ceylanicum]|uniref:Transthyretin-like family protein n=1 Tax=Ancylostoma ceylanicum TaxID=53326 RepID=A0A016WPE6_9BILA|nr:hypothetical protein Y032_0581g275 [Ancylostoma ceylanicum]